MIKKVIFLLFALTVISVSGAGAQTGVHDNDPVADQRAVVEAGNARFTVLTQRMIRMEWSADGQFEDRATLGIVNRRLPVPEFKVSQSKSKVTIKTADVTLIYNKTGKFSEQNLQAEFRMNGKKVIWKPGMSDSGNLKGTVRTLDKFDGINPPIEPYSDGLISRDGWVIVDESERHVLIPDDSRWGEWVGTRNDAERCDLYLMAYGHDYKAAIHDYTLVGGRVPLPPKYALGYWWSRYWQYSDYEIRDIAKTMASLSIPMDVMVIDMDWHNTWGLRRNDPPRDEYGQRIGWTGYTWQHDLFPSPENLMSWLRRNNLRTTLNLHPASGIQPYEEIYEPFVKDYGWQEPGKPVPFHMDEQKWADSYFKTIINPMERQGVDFWWLDWQQWKESKFTPGLNNTFWLNYTFFRDMEINYPERRPMIYHRWGGLGNHRYQIAFSGDTYDTWEVLGYLPYFTATASNVCYGYWGHDIGGHMHKGKHLTDPEMLTRWLQYGVFTPIFKTHSTKSQDIERRIWMFPDHFQAMRDAIRLRYNLSPYIYNAARQTTDTGISMCRPMYYDHPEAEEAYTWTEQHMFGDDLLVTAVAKPADKTTGLSERPMWFPQGQWFDMATGMMIDGGQSVTLHYAVNENPWYARAGAIIPMAPEHIMNLQEECGQVVLTIIPGNGESTTRIYEDNGDSNDYMTEYAVTEVSKSAVAGRTTLRIAPRKGEYKGMPATRSFEVRLPAVLPPSKVTVNGKDFGYDRFGGEGSWTYNGEWFGVSILTGELPAGESVTIECLFDETAVANQPRLYGMQGLAKRFNDTLTPEYKLVLGAYDAYLILPDAYLKVAQFSSFATERPFETVRFLDDLDRNLPLMLEDTEGREYISGDFKTKLRAYVDTIRK